MKGKSWCYYNPVSIRYGRGVRLHLIDKIKCRNILIVCSKRGRKQLESDRLLGSIINEANIIWIDSVIKNPSFIGLQSLISDLIDTKFDVSVAVGGGSVIDSAKVLTHALRSHCDDLRELIKTSPSFPPSNKLPLYALPTTSGTGSEATPYATIWDEINRKKLSLHGLSVYPTEAIIDPELSDELPYDVTLSSGLDAINQAAESIWNSRMNPLTETYAQQSLALGFDALPRLLDNLADQNARDDMAQASLLAGLAISQTRTALCHSISYPLTAHFGVPHGLACAFSMPAVLRHNIAGDDGRFMRLNSFLNKNGNNNTQTLAERFDELNRNLNVAVKVRSLIRSREALFDLVDEMFTPDRAENNLVPADKMDIKKILEMSWDQ